VSATRDSRSVDRGLPDRRYVRSLFEWLAPNYNRAVLTYSLAQDLRWKSELLRRLRPRRGERALDLACGTGLIYDRISRKLGVESVVGLDINRAMLASAGSGRIQRRLVRADSTTLPFCDATFDLVTAGYLFKYVPLDRLAREVRRVLRPGGRFGGYDFSAPIRHTLAGGIYDLYLQKLLPFLGDQLGGDDGGWRELLTFLSQVAKTSGWETHVKQDFARAGFGRMESVPSLGGAITWFWSWMPVDRPPPG
jgi:demethylmenaquinone methyltransferase / 2-methoxy-6-polyprenyl-1,4-benzoquinol methylase